MTFIRRFSCNISGGSLHSRMQSMRRHGLFESRPTHAKTGGRLPGEEGWSACLSMRKKTEGLRILPAVEGCGLIDTVRCLPQKYRVVIHLFYYEELSVEEIAACLDLQESAVRTRLTRARKKLGELLKEEI